jgi:hypothetical protein
VAGGLISYGVDLRWCYRRGAYFADKILRGTPPGDLPVEFPTKMVLSGQSQDGERAGRNGATDAACSRRRGHRITLAMSAAHRDT